MHRLKDKQVMMEFVTALTGLCGIYLLILHGIDRYR
jgi:hypothetical protein